MVDDKNLSKSDIQTLATRDGVAAFFAALGYRTGNRQTQSASAMGVTAASLVRQIKHIERIAVHDDGGEPLDLYLLELTSVTYAATQGLAKSLRNRVGNYLLVVTDDYERLDFVLLQRSLPSSAKSSFSSRQVTVRPRILTVNRRDPSQVQLRVLRRFTYTEMDSDSQYEKLLSAYTIADWSEPMFNNRALFSDYYLTERLPELPEWRERPESVYHQLRELFKGFRQQSQETGDSIGFHFVIEPVLEALGFHWQKDFGGDHPDYLLSMPNRPTEPIAACLAYPWNRYLDGKDETRDDENPAENPGARVVNILESGDAPWAIVTNGKLWRLYSSRTHSRSTNYSEIDLEETLAILDPNEAFRYFWLAFRPSAFIPVEVQRGGEARNLCFLDRLLDESEAYAKGLGERLKERVFERVFPHFVTGFMEYLKAQVGLAGPPQASVLPIAQQIALNREPDEEFRRQVFNETLTLLYRLLFLLYAESRDLLPVREVRGYREKSLTKLKEEIANKAGRIEDEVPTLLEKSYSASANSTSLHERLLELFEIIDQGCNDLNVPHYNGGLFAASGTPGGRSQEGANGQFLTSLKIPDQYLALGLDLLARDLDDKRQDLVFIDYKSLGVRQLGSIYEGLLEFSVRVAPQKMAVIRGKKTEEVFPYEEVVGSNRRVLTIGRGRHARERVYEAGEVYLENDQRERKSTGSYYTPDHIVKYIVKNTVGPVLKEKFDALRPQFREAGYRYRQELLEANASRNQGRTLAVSAELAKSDDALVDDLFDLRVLDPAMGSGHFLVEAVDFICDRILGEREGFLRAFPWNPVTRYLQDTRESIIAEMESQGIAVDTTRLTDINLLKRHVLKRCVYGVDLNPMAVELSKVSLWLDCFTIGAPLSFLDHHLKCGNSLIGTSVQEVEAELIPKERQTLSLFGGPFQGMLAATASIESLRRIPDATADQVEQSHTLYANFQHSQAPFKTALDIWLSGNFDNELARQYLTLAGSDLVDQIRAGGAGLSNEYREVIAKAIHIAQDRRLFHWDLEFPEAFVDLENGRWKPPEEQGFDVVVGNPPYHRIQGIPIPTKSYLNAHYDSAVGKFDLSVVFVECGYKQLKERGQLGLIIPNKPLTSDYGKGLRKMIAEARALAELVDFQDAQVFPDASIYACLLFLSGSARETSTVRTAPSGRIEQADRREVPTIAYSDAPWSSGVANGTRPNVVFHTLGQACEAIFQGLISGADSLLIGNPESWNNSNGEERFPYEPGIMKPLLRGKNVRRFEVQESGEYVIYPYDHQSGKTTLLSESELETRYPRTYSYLFSNKAMLDERGSENMRYPAWYALWNPRTIERFQAPKLLTQVLADKATFAVDPVGNYWFVGGGNAGVYGVIPRKDLDVDIWYLLAFLNSSFFDQHVKSISSRFRGGFYSYAKRFIEDAPIRVTGFSSDESQTVSEISFLIRTGHKQGGFEDSIWPRVNDMISGLHEP